MAIRPVAGIGHLLLLTGSALGQPLFENFQNVANLPSEGWVFANRSSPLGTTGWYQGTEAFDYPLCIASDFFCGSGNATQSNWLMLPPRMLYNDSHLNFSTRTVDNPSGFPDRLQVRMSRSGDSTNVGSSATDVGDFDILLWDINPTYSPTGYPGQWSGYHLTLHNLPPFGVNGRLAFRYFVENGGPEGIHGALIGITAVDYSPGGPFGACCKVDGTCAVLSEYECATALGFFRGVNIDCAAADCASQGFYETQDAGALPAAATVVRGPAATPLQRIIGTLPPADVDTYKITICDRASFSAATMQSSKQLALFDLAGRGVVLDVAASASVQQPRITGQFVPVNGDYYLTISDPVAIAYAAGVGNRLWAATNNSGHTYPEWAPNGPGASSPIQNWFGFGFAGAGGYSIELTGACYVNDSCFANCDQSTTPPVLNVNDFMCFINKYAIGDPDANCDGSTGSPVLNINDFQCFLIQFSNGCPS